MVYSGLKSTFYFSRVVVSIQQSELKGEKKQEYQPHYKAKELYPTVKGL